MKIQSMRAGTFFKYIFIGIIIYFGISFFEFMYVALIHGSQVLAKPPTFRHVLLSIFYAPVVENIVTTIVVFGVNGLIVAPSKLLGRLQRKADVVSYKIIGEPSFGLALIVVYLLAVSTHGYPTGVFAGFTFVAFVFLIFPDNPRSFSLVGFIGSCIVHLVNNCLSLTIGPYYLFVIQQLFSSG